MLIRTTVLSIGAAVMLAGTAHAQAVGIGTGPAASLTNRIGSAIAKVIADGAGLNTRVLLRPSCIIARPRSVIPPETNRKIPSRPQNPLGLVIAAALKSGPFSFLANTAANAVASYASVTKRGGRLP